MSCAKNEGRKVDCESVCAHFIRIPESLIEEPEVCEWCEFYDEGLCFHKDGQE
jgi:hypothetical protein